MAPLAPLGKQGVLAQLRSRGVPFSFGSPHPWVAVVKQDGVFRVRELVVDPDESAEKGRTALASGGIWMPEQHYDLGKPTGKIFLEAASIKALAEKIEAYAWPKNW